ncbi:MAG: LptE family protein [Candidatus Aminicenantes bacterium]
MKTPGELKIKGAKTKSIIPASGLAGLFLVTAFLGSCGYHLRGTGSSLPTHITSIHVPMFENKTTRYQLDLKLTQAVINELVSRGKVEVQDDSGGADAVLVGEITSFSASPIAFSGVAAADRYNINIVAKVTLRDLVNSQVVFSSSDFVYQGEYDVPEGTDFETVEQEAVDEISEKFARSLVITMLEGF